MLTQRLGSDTQKNEEFMKSFVKIVKENPGSCDEVWIASNYGYPKMDVHKKSAEDLSKVAKQLREVPLRVSLQISNTIGHGSYMSARDCSGLVYEGSPVENLVNYDGTVADYAFCWNGENFRKYVKDFVAVYSAKIQPYTVWVDDDLRVSNHTPVRFGCFCDKCVERFNNKYNANFTRETLVHEINYGELVWREKYVEFLRKSLYDFTYLISKTVHDNSPESYMGFQYCSHGSYDGYGYEHIFSAMKDATGKNPKSRPGGGAYNDHNPNEFIDKAKFIAWQNCMLPEYVTEKRPEVENLPDVKFGKTIAGTCFETSLYMAYGNNSMSYAMLMNDYDPMEWQGEMLHSFAKHRPYWEKLCEYSSIEGSMQGGLRLYYSKEIYKKKVEENETSIYAWNLEPYTAGSELMRCAIPFSYDNNLNPTYVIHAESARRFTKNDVEFLLTKPCITDGGTLKILQDMGYGDLFSATAQYADLSKMSIKFLDHEVNKNMVGKKWAQSFYFTSGFTIIDNDGSTEPFTAYTTNALDAQELFPQSEYKYGYADCIVKTKKGAKWAVFGNNPWNAIFSCDKRQEFLNVAEYLNKGCMCATLETPVQAFVMPRQNKLGQTLSVSIVNATIGDSGKLSLKIKNPIGENFVFMSQKYPEEKPLSFKKNDEDYLIEIENIEPWNVASVFIK